MEHYFINLLLTWDCGLVLTFISVVRRKKLYRSHPSYRNYGGISLSLLFYSKSFLWCFTKPTSLRHNWHSVNCTYIRCTICCFFFFFFVVHPWSHHYNQDNEYIHYPLQLPLPLYSLLPTLPHPTPITRKPLVCFLFVFVCVLNVYSVVLLSAIQQRESAIIHTSPLSLTSLPSPEPTPQGLHRGGPDRAPCQQHLPSYPSYTRQCVYVVASFSIRPTFSLPHCVFECHGS